MRYKSEHLAELVEHVKAEGNPRLLVAPVTTFPDGVTVPETWKNLLMLPDAHREAAKLLWAPAEEFVPDTIAALSEVLQAVGLLITDTKRPSLVYVFTKGGAVFARRGFPPSPALPQEAAGLAVNLSVMYGIHDGWVDFFSGDTGLLPVDEWKVLGRSEAGPKDGFLEVFNTGGNGMGFDLSESPAPGFIIWSDGEVSAVEDFWKRLDSWVSDELENMEKEEDAG